MSKFEVLNDVAPLGTILSRVKREPEVSPVFQRESNCVPADMVLRSAIIYDDLSFFASAAARLQSVALRAEAHARWITRGWPITSLEQTATAERSLIESAEAHLIILPCRHAGRLPRCLHGWLTRWAGMRAIAEAAVAVLWDCGEMHSTWDVSPELIAFVRLHGLNFILEGDPNLGDEPQATQTSGECKTGLPANNIHLL